MARMPGAEWLGEHSPGRLMSRYDIVCFHTIVGYAPAHAAHFSVHGNGHIQQSRDTKYRSAANLDGNHRIIAIENEDMGPEFGPWPRSDEAPPLTAAQVEANAKILAWAHNTHGVPLQLCPNSRSTSRGLAYHRQGIDGNFGSYEFGGRVSGGELWSEHYGKVCPTDPRIRQRDRILARAKEIVTGDDDMPLTDAELDKIEQRFLKALRTPVEWVAPSVADMAAKRNWGNLSLAEKVEHTLRHANVLRDALDPTQDLMRQILTEAASDPDVDVALTPEQIDALGAASARHLLTRIGATDAPA